MDSLAAVDARVTGRVQGVGFRRFVEREAHARSISGWVRNRSDGSVEIHAEGKGVDVDRFLAVVAKGPRIAGVTALTRTQGKPEANPGFEVRPTV